MPDFPNSHFQSFPELLKTLITDAEVAEHLSIMWRKNNSEGVHQESGVLHLRVSDSFSALKTGSTHSVFQILYVPHFVINDLIFNDENE